jgi:ABC-2 type transport system permease protein
MTKLLAFLQRGFLHASSYRLNFFGAYLGTALSVVFFAILAQFYGNARSAALAPYGDYFTFLLIGGVFARYLSLGLRNFGRELELELAVGTLEPMLVTATAPALALLGPSLWTLLEGLLLMLGQLALGILFFNADFSHANWLSALTLAALAFVALNAWGLLSAAFVLVFKRAEPLGWLVDVTLFMLAGVYFPVSVMPRVLQVVAYALPLSHALEGLRFALMRGDSLSALARYVFILLGFDVLLLPLSLVAFRAALNHVKRAGSLGHY